MQNPISTHPLLKVSGRRLPSSSISTAELSSLSSGGKWFVSSYWPVAEGPDGSLSLPMGMVQFVVNELQSKTETKDQLWFVEWLPNGRGTLRR